MGEIANNNHQWRLTDRHIKRKEKEPHSLVIYQIDQSSALASQIEALSKKMEALMQAQIQPA